MDKIVELVMKSYGLVGFMLIAPLIGLAVLWRAYVKREDEHIKELSAAHGVVAATQEKRVIDAHSMAEKMMDLASEQSALNKETNLLLGNVNLALDRLSRGA